MVGGVSRKCGTTWMIEMRVKGTFSGMRAVRRLGRERRVLEG